MAAHEEHGQRVVVVGNLVRRRLLPGDELLAVPPRPLAPPLVDQPPGRRLHEPAARLHGHAVQGPARRRGEQRLLDGVLGRVEVAVPAHEDAEDLRRQLAQQVLDTRRDVQRSPAAVSRYSCISSVSLMRSSITRRTWTGCWVGTPSGPGTADSRAAISSARSSDSTSKTWNPASHSLNSWNGPSVTTGVVPSEVTIFARSGPVRISECTSSPLSLSSCESAR